MTTEYAPAPPGAAPMEDLDAQADAMEASTRFHQKVAIEAELLRIREAARAVVAAEKVADTNFDAAFLTRSQLHNLPTPEPLIDRVLPRHALAILRGRDASFKSFAAIDWACCLATGKPWQDHPIPDPVRVLYIAGEGAHGIRGRIDAWEYAWGRNVPDTMLTVRTTAPNMHQPGPAFHHLLDHVRNGRYGLIVVDTLRRVSGAADGNTSEMGLVVDNLDRLRQATEAGTVLTVAHTDKGDNDTRGFSGIEDDADVVWAAKRDEHLLHLELTKFKDGADGRRLTLATQATLGSLVLTGTTGAPEQSSNESQLAILDALRILGDGTHPGRELIAIAGLSMPTFYRALKDLIDTGQITTDKPKGTRTKYYALPSIPLDTEPTDDTEHTDQELTA